MPHSKSWKSSSCDAVVFRERLLDISESPCLYQFELAVRCAVKVPEGTTPSPSPGQHAATRSRRGSILSSPPITDGFGTGTPMPSPQSQSFSRSYGSILPTSLAYIVPSTRGCSPWRPDAVMSTTGRGRHSVLRIFKGRRERTGHHATCGALPAAGPYLRLSRFQGGQASSSYPEGNFGRNQLLDGSISLSPLYPSHTNDLHVSIAAILHQSFLWLRAAQA
ncbi:hypothetical protein CQW23_34419 [Capsicum baccatum]|uniref:Protein TAR1 n=1 Tax=Capsicum baccatum TaxID=33114 RepID=A0A2G2UZ24_CAPBA|nr:hypothetical protein CQW23_34419 [Capsicum baccatum]